MTTKNIVIFASIITFGLLASSVTNATPSTAVTTPVESSAAAYAPAPEVPTVEIDQPLEHPISLDDALEVAKTEELDAVGFDVANTVAIGEYRPDGDLSADGFEQWWNDLYGVDPAITAITVEVPAEPVDSTEGAAAAAAQVPEETLRPLEVDAPAFVEQEVSEGEVIEHLDDLESQAPAESSIDSALYVQSDELIFKTASVSSRDSWKPRDMEVSIEQVNNRTYITQWANWKSGSAPNTRPTSQRLNKKLEYGMEFAVDFYETKRLSMSTLRPFCPGGYEDYFLADNNGFSWGVSSGSSGISSLAIPYRDDFDEVDSCNKTSMAVGIARPWYLWKNSRGFYQVQISINSRVPVPGLVSKNLIGSGVQLVDDGACQDFPSAWSNPTLCMGDYLWNPDGVDPARLSLSTDRGRYAAPQLCYVSNDFGRDKRAWASSVYGSRGGCFHYGG